MSRDFAPKDHLLSHLMFEKDGNDSPYFANWTWHIGDKVQPMFTDEEMEDRRKHRAMAIMCSDLYATFRAQLTNDEFGKLSAMLTRLMNKVIKGESLEDFPEPVLTWFFNMNHHYYHEPNDAEFLDWVLKTYKKG